MNCSALKSLDNQALLDKTEALVREERRITVEVLQCLREVESRMMYAELGFSSLHEFCIKHLHYSEGSAHRRISSMRLLKNLPTEMHAAVESKMNEGVLTITNLSTLQSFLKIEKKESGKIYSIAERVELIEGLENRSKREVEKKLAAIQPKTISRESTRVLTEELTEIRFVADEQLMRKLDRVKEVSGHVLTNGGLAEVVSRLADEYLKKHDPMLKLKRESTQVSEVFTSPELESRVTDTPEKIESKHVNSASRHIPSAIRHQVWKRDAGKCTYVHHQSKQKCHSKYGLEIDHREPFSLGGSHELGNLRLLCRQHNQLLAKKHFG